MRDMTMRELVSRLTAEGLSFEEDLSGYTVDLKTKTIKIHFEKDDAFGITKFDVELPIDKSSFTEERTETGCFNHEGQKIATFMGDIEKIGFDCSVDFSKEGFIKTSTLRVRETIYVNDRDKRS